MAMIDHHSSNQSDLFYTDCFARGSNIYIQGYKDGKRWRHTAKSYEPTLYVKAKKGEHSYMNALDSGEPLLAKPNMSVQLYIQDYDETFPPSQYDQDTIPGLGLTGLIWGERLYIFARIAP